MLKRIAFICFILSLGSLSLRASHLLGGELTYVCNNNIDYLFTLKLYRDCNAATQFDPSAPISFYDNNGVLLYTELFTNPVITTVPLFTDPCQTAPATVCTEEAVYQRNIFLPAIPGGYHIVYQRCCRSPGTLNLANPGNEGNTYYTQIPDSSLAICNSSPAFPNPAPLMMCNLSNIDFDHGAIDPDGDSLVYSLCTPYTGGSSFAPQPNPAAPPPYINVVWAAGFNALNPVLANPGFTLDPTTGRLQGTPTTLGKYVIGICVLEYRNGVLLNETRRDFQLEVVPCQVNVTSAIAQQTTFCIGRNVNFQNNSVSSNSYHWDFGVPGLLNDTSISTQPTYTYPDTGSYIVRLIANPGLFCSDTSFDTVEVYDPVIATFASPEMQCMEGNEYDFTAMGTYTQSARFSWNFGPNATPTTDTSETVTGVNFKGSASNVVSLTISEEHCSDDHRDTVRLLSNPVVNFDYPKQLACVPYTIEFTNLSTGITPLSYLWNFGDGNTSTATNPSHTYDNVGLYDVSLTIETDSGCIDTVVLFQPGLVDVKPRPNSTFVVGPDSASFFEPIFTFTGTSVGITNCRLFFDDGLFSDDCDVTYEYKDTGDFRPYQVVWNNLGCTDTSWLDIRILPEFTIYFPDAFSPNGDDLNEVFRPKVLAASAYEFLVFDRWGELLYSTNDPQGGWNGRRRGKEAPIGVYVYKVTLRSHFGQEFVYYGDFTLVR